MVFGGLWLPPPAIKNALEGLDALGEHKDAVEAELFVLVQLARRLGRDPNGRMQRI